jgi:ferredoxin
MAFVGVRACELAALSVLRKAVPFEQQPFIVAVECMRAGDLCFCASMQTGPAVGTGYDLALDELDDLFLVRAGSERGQDLLESLPVRPAPAGAVAVARAMVAETATRMGRKLETKGVRELLLDNPEHPRWSEVATRCMACANCTMVCPTCFCTTVEDHTNLAGTTAERVELWDSCFNLDFTYTNGHPARQSIRSRYRQWLTHKLATWHDQFDTSGCVGCGRCIAWCPVGIDLTEEVAELRQEQERD